VASGGIIAALSIVPILAIRAVPVAQHTLEAPTRNDLVRRFLAIEVLFGFGAGSFLPFVNLFFADRYGVPFSALGLLLGVLAVAGSIGALLHGRFVASRLGAIPSIVLVETLSLPFALVAGFTGALPVAVGALAVRHFLMFGASGTVNASQPSSFTPAEELSGFVNVRLDEKWLAAQVDEIARAGTAFGRTNALAGKRMQVEFVSANPTGPLTVANARGGPLGDVLSSVLEFAGATVER